MGAGRKNLLIVILGQTASGKSSLAEKLARKFGGEIVCADSRKIYKGMVIGTASPFSPGVERKVPYHLFHFLSPKEEFNVALYKKIAIEEIKKIVKRGNLPFLVGGTGLYIAALTKNLSFPEIPPQKSLREKLEKKDTKELFSFYQKLDPQGAQFIERNNKRRLIRAIEVAKVTGKSFWQQRKKGKPLFSYLKIGLRVGEKELEERIKIRVKKMMSLGLEKEAREIYLSYKNTRAWQSIGYFEWEDYFQGRIGREEVINLIVRHTIQYAKRQKTWFKKEKNVHWIESEREGVELIKQEFSE